MDWIIGMQRAIDYIEDNLAESIDLETVASKSYSSSYHFQRVFSILCGFTVGEYIRNRRLAVAGAELAVSGEKVIDIALKYGYESPDSFAKAFKKFHGILPSQARNNGCMLKSYSRLVLRFSLEGGTIMDYRVEQKECLSLLGHKMRCTGSPTDASNAYKETKNHWLLSRNKGTIAKLKERRTNDPIWYDIYTDFEGEEFTHILAVESASLCNEQDFEVVSIPAHKYAVFETSRCESPDDEWPLLMKRIVSEWMPTTEYQLSKHPIINKLNFDKNYSKRYMEIWIPVEKHAK